jgi:hypothetical protein
MTTDELNELAHGLAYESCASLLEGFCAMQEDRGVRWIDTTPEGVVEGGAESIADALQYLEARGLIERHACFSDWVSVRDESEATR